MEGTIKWFNDEKGYGFATSDGKDYFLHYKEIQGSGFKSLKEGDKITFEPQPSPKGMAAKNVQKID